MQKQVVKKILTELKAGESLMVEGWVRTKRVSKNVAFITMNDGSTIKNLQVVVDSGAKAFEYIENIHTGTALQILGKLVESQGAGQEVELQADDIIVLGDADPDEYPLQPKKHSMEFLRENAHLRFRTNTFNAVFRIRHGLTFAIHNFFNDKGFYNIHTPIITGSDAEGAGAMFRVTTLDFDEIPRTDDGQVDVKQDFFGKVTNLTVSGQLEAELAALALSKVYTFGPTFRAENSNTSRHLAEFWMIEPEIAFCDINGNMDIAEEMLKYLVRYVIDNFPDELEFLRKRLQDEEKNKKQEDRSMDLMDKLQFILENDFARITYTEAFEVLKRSKPNQKKRFEFPVEEWGLDFQSEHERYLVEKYYKKPVIITDYPKDIKAFYMKQNDDGKTVRGMDVLFPGIGEIIGGSQREEEYDKLLNRIREMGIPERDVWWYLETRKFGSVVHSGYGLGFERLVLFVTGMSNIRDVIPFPRTPKNAEF